jgi:hypothetical protein
MVDIVSVRPPQLHGFAFHVALMAGVGAGCAGTVLLGDKVFHRGEDEAFNWKCFATVGCFVALVPAGVVASMGALGLAQRGRVAIAAARLGATIPREVPQSFESLRRDAIGQVRSLPRSGTSWRGYFDYARWGEAQSKIDMLNAANMTQRIP